MERRENIIFESVSGYDDAAFLRSVPSHKDFSDQNVFINGEGLITGVIDWEFHMVKPDLLAAAYPACIRYDGTADPRFVNKKSQSTSFFGWFVRRMQKGYDWNTMQYAVMGGRRARHERRFLHVEIYCIVIM